MEGRNNAAGVPSNGLLVFLVYAMFAVFALLLALVGARVYRGVVSEGREAASIRAAFSYVSNKVRMASGEIRLEEQGGFPVLALAGEGEYGAYETRIYYADGALREAFVPSEEAFAPEAGEKLVELAEFTMEETKEGQLLFGMVSPEGKRIRLHLNR